MSSMGVVRSVDARPQPAPAMKTWASEGSSSSGRTWTFRRKRYVAKSSPLSTGAEACHRRWGLYSSSALFVQLVLTSGYFLFGVRGADAGRTRGDEMPLKSPRSPSSRVIVASAWKVERYWTFGAGFWKRYFTARDHRLLSLAISAFPVSVGAGLGERDFTSVEWESHDYTRDPCNCASEKI